jgi:hypothetical protein
MNQNTKDQEWKALQSRINKLVDHFLKEDFPAIEYKSSVAGLLQLPSQYIKQNVEEIP